MAAGDSESRKGPGRAGVAIWLLAGMGLLAGSWGLAHFPPVARPATLDEAEAVSFGRLLLVAGGLPWLAQWAGCVVLVAAVARGRLRAGWAAVLYGGLLHLVVGLVWWIALAATWWNTAPVEAALETLQWSAARSLGDEPFGQFVLFESLGPLVCPLRLSGPLSMQGQQFLWAGLSSALVMAYWAWAVAKLRRDRLAAQERPRRQFLLALLLTAVYVSPMLLRATLRVAAALASTASLVE